MTAPIYESRALRIWYSFPRGAFPKLRHQCDMLPDFPQVMVFVLRTRSAGRSHRNEATYAPFVRKGVSAQRRRRSRGSEIVVDVGADALPDEGSIGRLVRWLDLPDVGGASAKQIPLPAGSLVAYHIDDVIWGTLACGKEYQMRRARDSYIGAVMFAFKAGQIDFTWGTNDDEAVGHYLLHFLGGFE